MESQKREVEIGSQPCQIRVLSKAGSEVFVRAQGVRSEKKASECQFPTVTLTIAPRDKQ